MEYWGKRAEWVDNLAGETVDSLMKRYTNIYTDLQDSITKEITSFIGSFSNESGLSVSELNSYLSPSELKGFRREVERYMAFAEKVSKENNGEITQDVIERYLNRLNKLLARVRVSRLEEVKAGIERYAIEAGIAQDRLFLNTVPSATEEVYDYVSYDMDLENGFSAGLNPIQLDLLFKQRWMDGSFSSRLWKDKENLMKNLEHTLVQGIALGHNPRKIASAMERNLRNSYNACERLARTEVLHFFNKATFNSYEEHGVKEYRFVASLDERTCPICGGLDGKTFRLSDAEEGINYPVIHPNCRCTTIPYYRLYEESGVMSGGTRVARDKKGKLYTVPRDMTYEEWRELVNLK